MKSLSQQPASFTGAPSDMRGAQLRAVDNLGKQMGFGYIQLQLSKLLAALTVVLLILSGCRPWLFIY